MDAAVAAKSGLINRLEGMALSATLQGLPAFASAALLGKLFVLAGGHGLYIIGSRPDEVIRDLVLFWLCYALLIPFLAARFPLFKASCEPLFFDASLSLSGKVTRWLAKPSTPRNLLVTVLFFSILAVAVLSAG